MKEQLITSLLIDPIERRPMVLAEAATVYETGDVISGRLCAENGLVYEVRNGIPRLVVAHDAKQAQTSDDFAFKWAKQDTYDSPAVLQSTAEWYTEKYGFASCDAWADFFDSRETILDLGCGSGFSASVWLRSEHWTGKATYIGADISEAVDVARKRLADIPNVQLVQADALALPFPDGAFDAVFSEGVLHHTPSTLDALQSAARVLRCGGQIHFYVYLKKAPIREFADDYVREQLAPLSEEEAWDALRPLTLLAQSLAEMKATVRISEDVPLLGIEAGEFDIQRLLYYKVAKLFWNPSFSFEENVNVNFDWYRPAYAHRHTPEEVREFCARAGLRVERLHVDGSGISVKASKSDV